MNKKRVRRNIGIVFLTVLIFTSCLIFLNNYLLPAKLKALLETNLANVLHRPVALKELSFNIFRGLAIDGFTIFEDESQTEVFLRAEQLRLRPLLLPILLRKEIVITALAIEELNIGLLRDKQGKFNIPQLPLFEPKAKTKQKLSFTLADFKIINSKITLRDAFLDDEQMFIFENVNGKGGFCLPAKVQFNFNSSLKDKAKNISLEGAYYFSNRNLKANLDCDELSLHKLSAYFKDKFPLLIENDRTDINLDISLEANKKLNIKGTSYFNEVRANFKPLRLDGNLDITLKGSYDLENNTLTEAKGSIILKENTLSGVHYVDKLEVLKGKISFSKEGLFITNLTGRTKDLGLTFAGYLKDPQQPQFELVVKSDLKLEELIAQLPLSFSERVKDIQIQGNTGVQLAFQGVFKENWTVDFSGNAKLIDSAIKSIKPAMEIKNINSQLHFSKDELIIDSLTMKFKDTAYSASAKVGDFSQPFINFRLSSVDLSSAGKLKFSANELLLESIDGMYKGINFNAAGNVTNLADPTLNIQAKLNSNIAKLDSVLPRFKEIIQKLKPAGVIDAELSYKGKTAVLLAGYAKLDCSSAQIRIGEFKIGDLNLGIQLQEKQVSLDKLKGKFYNGNLTLNAICDLEDLKSPQFQMNLNVADVDLSELAKETQLKNKDIKGTGALKYALRGRLNNPQSYIGMGSLSIKDGYLWQAPIFNKLAGFLSIPELKNVVFTNAFANYQIQNRQITTQDLTLLSENVAMIASGALGFDKSLDFLIQTEFSGNFYEALNNKGSTAPIFLEALSRYALNIKLTGRLAEPQFKLKPIAVHELLKDGIIKGLEKILE